MRRTWLFTLATFLVCLHGGSLALHAQSATAQITGSVTDQSGAVIAGAVVTVLNQLTGTARTTTTSSNGDYVAPLLPVGVYSVTAERPGFRAAKRTDIQLNVNQVIRVDLQVSVGQVTETVEVAANAVAVDTETSSVGNVVTERQVTQLPLNGRNFLSLLFLGNGAVETGGEQGSMRQGAGNAISINGARPTSNNYLLDGTSNTDTALGTPAAILSIDAIQEFKEQTATYSAEYGFSANQINIVSKSGTNELHGSVFWFLRNDALDANNFFNNLAGRPRNKLRQNQPGFVVGGPVVLPKLYNGRNKTFWLVNYEGRRTRSALTDFLNVPTPDQLAGRFTSTIIDPLTGQPFPNNTIPQARFSRLARLAVAKYFPAPNANLPQGNYIRNRAIPNDTDQYTIRADQYMGRFGSFFGRVTNSDYTNTSVQNTTEMGDVFFIQKTRNWQVSHSVPIGPTLVNQFRLGFIEATANQHGATANPADIEPLQLTGVFTNLEDDQRTYPAIGFANNGNGLAGGGSAGNDYQASQQPMWDIGDGATWIRGRHTLSFGANFRKWSLRRDLANDFLGQFTFSGFFTGNTSRDHAIADMLLGYFSNASSFQPAGFSVEGRSGNPREFNFLYFAPYFQDDWKVTSRLTLNMGLRWDFRTVPNETNNRMGWRDLSNPRGGLLVADETLVERGIVGDGSYYRYANRPNPRDASKKVFAPRFGFAFRPFNDEKTVIRGGYGIFFDSAEGREIDGAADIYPYVSRGQYIQSQGQTNLRTTDQMFPNFADLGPANPAANSFLAVSMSPEPKNPYVQQWSFGVQRGIGGNSTLELNYIGNKGTNLLMRRNIAQAISPSNPALCAANPREGDCPVLSRRPFVNFGTYIDSDWSGNSSYNAFNFRFEHRSTDLLFTTAYTWAKSIDNKSAAAGIGNDVAGWQGFLNNHDVRRDRGRSEFDVDHRLVSSFVYELPVGRGRKFLGSANRLADAFLGGWQVNGIVTLQKGFPMTITAADVGGLNDTQNTNRADVVGDINPSNFTRTMGKWFNTDAFRQPAAGFLGNSGRGILRAPGINNWDTGLFKNFTITERMRTQLRLESFNAFNHTQWGVPERNIADSRFGQIRSARAARINQLGLKVVW
ncbi:MAG TPA: carboxypeptidase-like regulatory domain-containing protein [Bryobacteraceae bacterium]|nr:carboxypeptidase-like regulatory domain-containing protein [Bryobacteraceae bacterium]